MTGLLLCGARCLIQLAASRRRKSPLVPRLVRHMSLLGSLLMVAYYLFSQNQDSVGGRRTCSQPSQLPTASGSTSVIMDGITVDSCT
jgi:lipid-A-disaccharide synthase-like uncharacterized protein